MGEWSQPTFDDAPLAIIDGDRGVNYPKQSDFSTMGHCLFLNAGNVTTSGFSFSQCYFVNKERDGILRKGKLKRFDSVLTTRGTVGNVGFYDESIPYEHVRINSGMVIFRPDNSRIIPRYLYLFLRSHLFLAQVAALTTGSAQPQLPIRDIQKIRIPLPPIYEQSNIALFLGALDDKIDLNRRMNETLEAMARAIFKDWFVDFGPVRAKAEGRPPYLSPEIWELFPDALDDEDKPVGWKVQPLLNHVHLLSGGTPKTNVESYWNGPVAWASAKDVSQCQDLFLVATERTITLQGIEESSTRLIPKYATVVVARGATTGRYCLFGKEMAMNQTCYGLVSEDKRPFWLNCAFGFLVEKLIHSAHGSVFDTITTKTIESARVIISNETLLEYFERTISPLFLRILSNIEESKTLSQLRDLLLPKLMSGEIRLRDAEKMIEVMA